MITLTPGEVTLAQLEQIWRGNDAITLHSDTKAPIEAAAAFVSKAAAGDVAVYGVNIGFGKLANVTIAEDQTATLQRNLVLSHCCGVGEILEAPTTSSIRDTNHEYALAKIGLATAENEPSEVALQLRNLGCPKWQLPGGITNFSICFSPTASRKRAPG